MTANLSVVPLPTPKPNDAVALTLANLVEANERGQLASLAIAFVGVDGSVTTAFVEPTAKLLGALSYLNHRVIAAYDKTP